MFPELIKAAQEKLKSCCILDGEALAYSPGSSFLPFSGNYKRRETQELNKLKSCHAVFDIYIKTEEY